MKKTFVIRPHSFVDVITNSSSELFIISGDKDVDMVIAFLKEVFPEENDYRYSISSVRKIHTKEEQMSTMFELIDDITPYDNHYRMKIIEKLESDGIDMWDKHEEFVKTAGIVLKQMLDNKEIEFKGNEYQINIGDIIISGKENAICGEEQEKIIEKFNAIRFFGSPLL